MANTKLDILSLGRTNTVSKTGPYIFTSNNIPEVWNVATTYAQFNVVEYGTALYRSKIPGNVGNQPDVSPNEWERMYTNLTDGDSAYIFNGASSGKRMRIGGVWVKLSSDLIGTVTNSMFHWDGTAFTENIGMLLNGYEIRGFDDTASDAVKAADVTIGGSNKTAGTGDGGDLILRGGSSAGGKQGDVVLDGYILQTDVGLSSDPTGTSAQQIYYNTTTNKYRYYNGTIWQDLGSGSGGAGTIEDSLLKLSFNDSAYDFITADVFEESTANVDTVATTATLNVTTGTYDFTAGEVLKTLDLIDSAFGGPLKEATVTVFFGATVDTGLVCELSRDNEVTWETVTLVQNPGTKEWSGRLVFDPATEISPINLRLRLTASASCNIRAFGVMYGPHISQIALNVPSLTPTVGTPEQVAIGLATHSSLQAAINDLGTGGKITLISHINENITINKSGIVICGIGEGSKLTGDLTLTTLADFCVLREFWYDGNLIDNGSENLINIVWDS